MADGEWAVGCDLSLTAAGHSLHAEWRGPRPDKAPTLVFLHEGLGSIEQWKDYPVQLGAATGCGVLVYDRWGYGRSDPLPPPHHRPPGFMHDEGLIALPQIFDRTGIERAVLYGHSDGGTIALLAASSGDARICGVVTEAAHVFIEAVSISSIAAIRADWESTDLRERLARYHGTNVDGAFLGWADVWLDSGFVDFNIEAALTSIPCPVLALQGTDDQYGTPAQLNAIKTGIGDRAETHLLPDCGHAPHKDATRIVFELARRFVERTIAWVPGN